VDDLIGTFYIRLPSTTPAKLRSLPLRAMVVVAALAIIRRAEGAWQYSDKDDTYGWDARAYDSHCNFDG
jgi:hypothetical protein